MNTSERNNIPSLVAKKVGIIGAGPAGSLIAWLLASYGYDVHVFDKSDGDFGSKVCGEYLCPKGVELLQELGLSKLLTPYQKLEGMILYSPNQTEVCTTFPQQKIGLSLQRKIFDRNLISLAQQKGVRFHFQTPLYWVRDTPQGPTIGNDHLTETFDFLIGADGRQSLVARYLNTKGKYAPPEKRIAIHAYLAPQNQGVFVIQPKGEMHIFKDGSYCGLNPQTPNQVNFSLVCSSAKLQRFENTLDLVRFYVDQSPRLQALFAHSLSDPSLTFKVLSGLRHDVKNVANPQGTIFLVGDAAGFVDPLTGEGIFHALATAKKLSESLIRDIDLAGVAKTYTTFIHQDFTQKSRLNKFFQKVIQRAWLSNFIAWWLNRNTFTRDTFIGLIGNIYTPTEALKKWLLTNPKGRLS
jgi:flavin-dependent dehydrogenase